MSSLYTWVPYTGSGSNGYYDIASSSNGAKIASCVFNGSIYTSTDSGATFTERTGAGSRQWFGIDMSADGSIIVGCVLDGYIYVSSDGGATWDVRQVSGTTQNWSAVKVTPTGKTMYASNLGSSIYTSTDFGLTWTAVTPPGGSSYYALATSSSGTIVYAGSQNGGNIRKSTNSGASWSNAGSASALWRSIETSSDGLHVVASITGSDVYVSSNGGTSWTLRSIPSQDWVGVTMTPDASKMYVIGGNLLYYSLNYGVTWGPLTITGNPGSLRHVTTSSTGLKIAVTGQGSYIYLGTGPDYLICFREGSKILTLNPATGREEYVPVERLRPGTLVKTHMSGYVPVCMIGTSTVTIPEGRERTSNRLYVCSKRQFPELTEDLYITGRHSILVESLTDVEREACAEDLGRVYVTESKYRLPAHIDRRAQVYEAPGAVERIWHFALENNDEQMNYGVYANGLLVESCSIWRLRTMVGYTIMDSRSQVYIVGDEGDVDSGNGVAGLLQNTARSIVC
jgi:hypothetical protein